jgi:hypothetical protein
MSRIRIPLLALVVVVSVGLAAAEGFFAHPGPSPGPSGSPTPGPGGSPVVAGRPPTTAGYTDQTFGPDTHDPTAGPGEAKLWEADGTWWAAMIGADKRELHIARLDAATQRWLDTGVLIDARPHVAADALWDGTTLSVVTAGSRVSTSEALRITQFRFDASKKTWILQPDFPVMLTQFGVDAPGLARDSAGRLWLTYVSAGKVAVRHTLADARHWTADVPPATSAAAGAARLASIVAGDGRIAVAVVRPLDDTLRVALHEDAAADGAWTEVETAISGIGGASGGASLRSVGTGPDWRLLAAMETTGGGQGSLDTAAVVAALSADHHWSIVQLARQKDHFERPTLAVDPTAGIVYAFGASAGQLVYKRSLLGLLAFDSGTGDVLLGSPTSLLRDPSVPKADVSLANGIVVIAADSKTATYAHAVLQPPGATPVPQGAAPTGPAPTATLLLDDTFDPETIGSVPSGWETTPQGRGRGRAVVVAGTPTGNHILRVAASTRVGAVRSCASVAPTSTGNVTITGVVRLDAIGASDAKLASIRGPGGEIVAIRVDRHGRIAWYNGVTKVTTTRLLGLRTWVRATITVHLATKRWDWTLTTLRGSRIVAATGVRWRTATIPAVDSVCVETPDATPAAAISVDRLTVRR